MKQLENTLNNWLGSKAPVQLPATVKQTLVKYIPYLALLGALLTALAVLGLVQALFFTTNAVWYGVSLQVNNGGVGTAMVVLWLSLLVVAVEAALYAMAFMPLKARRKKGWNMLYWVTLLGAAYALLSLLLDGRVGSFLFSLLSCVVGLYILFQIRDSYLPTTSKKRAATSKS